MSLSPVDSNDTALNINSIQLCPVDNKSPEEDILLASLSSVVQTDNKLSVVQQARNKQTGRRIETRLSDSKKINKEHNDVASAKANGLFFFLPSRAVFHSFLKSPTEPSTAQNLLDNMTRRNSNYRVCKGEYVKTVDTHVRRIDNVVRKFIENKSIHDVSYLNSDIKALSGRQSHHEIVNGGLKKLLPSHGKAALSSYWLSLQQTSSNAWDELHPSLNKNSVQAQQYRNTQNLITQMAETHISALTDPDAKQGSIEAYSLLFNGICLVQIMMAFYPNDINDELNAGSQNHPVEINPLPSDNTSANNNHLLNVKVSGSGPLLFEWINKLAEYIRNTEYSYFVRNELMLYLISLITDSDSVNKTILSPVAAEIIKQLELNFLASGVDSINAPANSNSSSNGTSNKNYNFKLISGAVLNNESPLVGSDSPAQINELPALNPDVNISDESLTDPGVVNHDNTDTFNQSHNVDLRLNKMTVTVDLHSPHSNLSANNNQPDDHLQI
ncbi:type III secretion system protein [Erwinia amylovora]|uniref:type III secretion system protein n=1 Tax=Erwinia amylovora TaxID=552 RepID=UPI00144446AC|nr:type III secretion system protein [Erwinia amylovora]